MLDLAEIRIGDNCLICPDVGIYTAGHRLEPEGRIADVYGLPITIGHDVWIGGQEYAKGFYENVGFKQSSETFMLDGIPHIRMALRL